MLIARRSLKGAASRPHQRHRQAVSEDRGGRRRPPLSFHGLPTHTRAGADPRVRARALRARARPARARVGRGRGAAARARRDARRGRLPRRRPAGGARRRRPRLGLVLPALRGARQGRLVGARDRLGLERALRQDGREVGDGRAEGLAPARPRERRAARLLRAHRAGLRLRRGGARHPRGARRRRLAAHRLEGLHHARLLGVDRDRLRPHRRRRAEGDQRVPRPDRTPTGSRRGR